MSKKIYRIYKIRKLKTNKYSNYNFNIKENLLKQGFKVITPKTICLGVITYIGKVKGYYFTMVSINVNSSSKS